MARSTRSERLWLLPRYRREDCASTWLLGQAHVSAHPGATATRQVVRSAKMHSNRNVRSGWATGAGKHSGCLPTGSPSRTAVRNRRQRPPPLRGTPRAREELPPGRGLRGRPDAHQMGSQGPTEHDRPVRRLCSAAEKLRNALEDDATLGRLGTGRAIGFLTTAQEPKAGAWLSFGVRRLST